MRVAGFVRAALASAGVLLSPSIAEAGPWAPGAPYCGSTWTTACASATVELVNGSLFASRGLNASHWVLKITVHNVSVNDPVNAPGVDAEASVIREMLFNVEGPDGAVAPTVKWWVTDGAGNDWRGWSLKRDGEFNRIGQDWTQQTSGKGICTGIITDPNVGYPPLPCGDDPNHRTSGVFYLAFNTNQIGLDAWAAHMQNIDAPTCGRQYGDDDDDDDNGSYCESDWAVVPEPGTLALLGTGLFGIGMGFIRRRKKNAV